MQIAKQNVSGIASLVTLVIAVSLVAPACSDSTDAPSAATPEAKVSKEVQEILALEADPEYGEYLAGECSSCHNPKATDDSKVPKIHAVSRQSIIENLLAYKSGERDNTTMKGVAEKFSKEEIAALAIYLAEYEAN